MTQPIDIFFFNFINYCPSFNTTTTLLYKLYLKDLNINEQLIMTTISNMYVTKGLNIYLNFYMDAYYNNMINQNLGYIVYVNYTNPIYNLITNVFYYFLFKIFKINLFMFIIYTIFIWTNFSNYILELKGVNKFVKLFILNATEKDVGPVDDYFFFAILFMLTIILFIFSGFFLIMIQSNSYIWAFGAFVLLALFMLTIPVNLFIDFGAVFCTTIKGSASSNNLVKELLFDIISTTTVFIRFVIQNIRFLFIFSGIFELLEWTFSTNNGLFLSQIYSNHNVFINLNLNIFNTTNFNILIINSILFVILYFYYFLHLLFLLLVQITIYIGISIWLFFFFILN